MKVVNLDVDIAFELIHHGHQRIPVADCVPVWLTPVHNSRDTAALLNQGRTVLPLSLLQCFISTDLFVLGRRDHDEDGALHDVVVGIECQVICTVCAVVLAELIDNELMRATDY